MAQFDTHHAYTRLTEDAKADPKLAEVLVDVFGRDRIEGFATKQDLEKLSDSIDKRFATHREWTLRLALACLGIGLSAGLGGVAALLALMG